MTDLYQPDLVTAAKALASWCLRSLPRTDELDALLHGLDEAISAAKLDSADAAMKAIAEGRCAVCSNSPADCECHMPTVKSVGDVRMAVEAARAPAHHPGGPRMTDNGENMGDALAAALLRLEEAITECDACRADAEAYYADGSERVDLWDHTGEFHVDDVRMAVEAARAPVTVQDAEPVGQPVRCSMADRIDTSPAGIAAIMDGVAPGPWRVGPVDDCRVEDADGNEVSQIDGDYNHPDLWPIMEANARFIAAARELVPALAAERDAALAATQPAASAVTLRITGPNSDGEYWLHLKNGNGPQSAGINLGGEQQGMMASVAALLKAAAGGAA